MEKVKKLKILPSYKEDVYVVKEDKENVLDSHQKANHADQIKINRRKSMHVTTSQYETSCKNISLFLSYNLLAGEKIHRNKQHFARGKCRV